MDVPITAAALEGQEEFHQMVNNYRTLGKKHAGSVAVGW